MYFALAVVVSSISIFLYHLIYSDLFGPLRHIPGPFLSRFTRLWELHALNGKQNYTDVVHKLHERFGPVVRLAPGRYSISDAQAAREIYHHGSKFIKGNFYHGFAAVTAEDKLFVDRDPVRHAKNRRNVASLYSMSNLRAYEPSVDDVSALFKDRLTQLARNGSVVCLPDWMQYYAFDVIGMMTFSHSFGLLESGSDKLRILDTLFNLNHLAPALGVGAPKWWLWVYKRVQSFPLLSSTPEAVNKWVLKRVQERLASLQQKEEKTNLRSDFLEKGLELEEKGKVTDQARMNVISQNVAAGSDTTGVTLGAIAWFLSQNPTALAKLREELAHAASEGRLSQPVTFAEANAMPYLQAIIKESLRMHPAVGLMLERAVPDGGAMLAGHFFPTGTMVGCSAWELNFNTDIWGDDAELFRPERWLGDDVETTKRLDGALFSFGAGSRTCIGKNISLLEMSKLIPELYRRFDFELTSPGRTIDATWFVYHKFDVRVKELEKPI